MSTWCHLWPTTVLFGPGRGAEHCDQPVCLCVYVSVSLFASISLEPLDRSSWKFVRRSSVAVARSSSGDVALRYVLPVLWMTSRLAVMGGTPARVGSTQRRRSITCATGAEWVWCLLFRISKIIILHIRNRRLILDIRKQCFQISELVVFW